LLTIFAMPAFRSFGREDARPVFAVGFIREDDVPKSTRGGRVLTDMLATNLSRVEGLTVLSNSRVLAVMRQGSDSAAAYADAARRAGASELLEGRLLMPRTAPVGLEIRRVELRTGTVKDVYRVTALDQYGLVDSLTKIVALRFRLRSPRSSIAEASTSSPMAYRLYEEGLRAYYQSDTKAAQRLMRAALEEDSTFALAAYYEALIPDGGSDILPDGRHVIDVVRTALRLAQRAPERERLTITANLLVLHTDASALAIAESLTTRYPDDPRALMTLEKARWFAGDWAGAVAALERAIVLDSIGDHKGIAMCHLCRDFEELSNVYLWWDSLPAAAHVMQRYAAAKPDSLGPFFNWAVIAARLRDSVASDSAFRRLTSRGGDFRQLRLSLDLTLERYDLVELEARPLHATSGMGEWGVGAWNLLIALRNQGRLREATQFHRTGTLAGFPKPAVERTGDPFNEGILALERGDPRAAAKVFGDQMNVDMSWWMPGVQARHVTWNGTLRGMALAAAGDTAAVRALADTVEASGRRSAYGRDRKAHHYLRGLVLAAAERHEEATSEFRAAIHSPTLGFTRVNYELARCLLRLGRAREAVAALQPALRGEVDASNLYITRTDLHELLAQAFVAAGQPDSAAVHYRAVVKAWQQADPQYHDRRARASAWLAGRR
jgi:tetratricopeptide (TPR) repeat protein